ncbi:hypothetical protein [Pseudomonas sp. TE3610]
MILRLLLLTFAILFVWAFIASLRRANAEHKHRMGPGIEEPYTQALIKAGLTPSQVMILKDRTASGSRSEGMPFQVHRIVLSPPERYFVYIHIEDTPPVLSPISAKRAQLAAGGNWLP